MDHFPDRYIMIQVKAFQVITTIRKIAEIKCIVGGCVDQFSEYVKYFYMLQGG